MKSGEGNNNKKSDALEEEVIEKKSEETIEDLPEKTLKSKTARKILGLSIVIILVVLFVLFTRQDFEQGITIDNPIRPESYRYNGFLFQKGTHAWYSKIRIGDLVYDISFIYGPREVENISIIGKVNDLILKAKEIYVTTEPYYTSKVSKAQVEISKITSPRTTGFGVLNIPTLNTVTEIPEEMKGKITYPEITCENATLNTSVIYLKIGQETKIYNESYCVIVEGSSEDEVIRAADRLVYNLLGIIK